LPADLGAGADHRAPGGAAVDPRAREHEHLHVQGQLAGVGDRRAGGDAGGEPARLGDVQAAAGLPPARRLLPRRHPALHRACRPRRESGHALLRAPRRQGEHRPQLMTTGEITSDLLHGGVTTLEIAAGAWAASATALLRSTPQLILLYLVFFGLPSLGIDVGGLTAAIVVLGVADASFN